MNLLLVLPFKLAAAPISILYIHAWLTKLYKHFEHYVFVHLYF